MWRRKWELHGHLDKNRSSFDFLSSNIPAPTELDFNQYEMKRRLVVLCVCVNRLDTIFQIITAGCLLLHPISSFLCRK